MPPKNKKQKPTSSPPTESLPSAPTEINPYTVLSIPPTSTTSEIRTAYRKLALQWHPDKNPDKPSAHTKFQEIAFAYAILSDEGRRRRYDATGSLSEVEEGDFDWKGWFSDMWRGVISGDTIREFKEKYQGNTPMDGV
jgi:DnaJ homolog subfamily C member 9